MAFKMFSTSLVLAFVGMCLCQQPSSGISSQYQSAVSQASFQTGSAAVQPPQTKLEDIERDSLTSAYGQKTQSQAAKPSAAAATTPQQQQQQQSYQSVAPQQQYYIQPYQGQQQFFMQPFPAQQQYLAQPYPGFDYSGVQYMIISPNVYPGNQVFQQYYMSAQPSAVPQYVTKPSNSASTSSQTTQEYKQQQFATPSKAQQEYKQQQQQQIVVPVQAAPQQYVVSVPTYQYVQQPASSAPAAAAAAAASPVDFSYVTRHPATSPAQFKSSATAAAQPQAQYSAVPQEYQQSQFYYVPSGQIAPGAVEQTHVQQSAKSHFSSGVKSTTPYPLKEPFAYKFESSPPPQQQQQQQSGSAYSTLKYSA